MKTTFSFSSMMAFAIVCIIGVPTAAKSQDAEKQKVIDVITKEVDYWYKKDRTNWMNSIVPSNDFQMSVASPLFYYIVQRFDSLVHQREAHFTTPADPNEKRITKSDFKVSIKGPIAIVDLTQTGENFAGPFKADQTVLLEKQGKTWKILRQSSVNRTEYEVNDHNVEMGINIQGYRLLQMKKVDEAIKVFILNTQLYPNAFNTWDSLGEAYMIKGEKQLAIGCYKKSIELNPQNEGGKKMVEKMMSSN